MRIVYQSQSGVDDWLNKTGKYENRESKASDILSIARMKEGGLHGNMFDTTTGEVVLYTAAGEGAGTASMGKWESGISRGLGNPVGVNKWADSYQPSRGKANPLW